MARLVRANGTAIKPKDLFPGRTQRTAQRALQVARKKIAPKGSVQSEAFRGVGRSDYFSYKFDPPTGLRYCLIEKVQDQPGQRDRPPTAPLDDRDCPECGRRPHRSRFQWGDAQYDVSFAIADQLWLSRHAAHKKQT